MRFCFWACPFGFDAFGFLCVMRLGALRSNPNNMMRLVLSVVMRLGVVDMMFFVFLVVMRLGALNSKPNKMMRFGGLNVC